ncbi:MAG: metallophosphoesterase [Spirochaetes bacterium]|nr:metallophosphoesterase [Spirochaetota bacterium]
MGIPQLSGFFFVLRKKAFFGIMHILLAVSFASGCWNGIFGGLYQRNDLGARPDTSRATGIEQEFIHFAQFSDVHIVDDDNPLRFENIKLVASSPGDLGDLDILIQSISRDQDRYSARIWDSVIRSINEKNAVSPFDFAISTGDHTDTGLLSELRWFIEIADGIKSPSLEKAVLDGTMEDVDPVGLDVPWYAVVGNHDVEYQGTLNNYAIVTALLSSFGDTGDLSYLPDPVDLYGYSISSPWWHGFDFQPPESRARSYGYYSFNASELVHCIILDTAIYNLEGEWPVETFAEGCLDRTQFDWMIRDIEDNRDRLCIIFSHHSPTDSFADQLSQVKSEEFMKALCAYDNVIAHLNGHSHINEITPVKYDCLPGGYWNINTSAIIEWPQEWRDITVEDNGDGTGLISCRMVQHSDTESLDVAGGDPDAQKDTREGTRKDRNVALKIQIPVAVKERILGM